VTSAAVGRRRVCIAGAAALVGLSAVRRARAEGTASFYHGNTVRFVVGSGPGGGNDSYARLLAPHLAKALRADIVVENHPGAGGLLALNQVYVAEPDGLTIMIANAAAASIAQLLGLEGVRFDMRRIVWLAGIEGELPVVLLSARSTYRTLADMRAAQVPVKWSSTGRTSPNGVWTALAMHALDVPSNLIVGYKSSSEAALAAMRGEADGIILTSSSAKTYAKDGLLLPVTTLARTRSPLFPDVPTLFELVELPPEKAWWIDYCIRYAEVGRALVGTPGIPEERAAALRAACRQVLTDKAVLDEAEKAGRPLAYRASEEVRGLAMALIDGVEAERLTLLRRLLAEDGT
jgi:tripartite-type tricarboxylate transporter receptor subunit TctC